MRLRPAPILAVLAVLAGCTSVPAYDGGPTESEPYGIVQPEEHVKLWTIDGKPAFNKEGPSLVGPGNHKLVFRVDYPIDDESQHPQDYIDFPLTIEAGLRYRIFVRGEWEKGPPYDLDQKVTKIRGYGAT